MKRDPPRLHEGIISSSRPRPQAKRTTFILISLITLFMILVVPSQFLSFLHQFFIRTQPGDNLRTTQIVLNLCQALNFSINFLLYCFMSKDFRDTVRKTFCTRCCPPKRPLPRRVHSSSSGSMSYSHRKYRLVSITNEEVMVLPM